MASCGIITNVAVVHHENDVIFYPNDIQGGSKKVSCYTLMDNLGKHGPISIILSLLDS